MSDADLTLVPGQKEAFFAGRRMYMSYQQAERYGRKPFWGKGKPAIHKITMTWEEVRAEEPG